MPQPTVFISYSHKDEEWKDLLMKHLSVLQAQGLIDIWQDRRIESGADWHTVIQEAMQSASIAVLIITGNSLTSEYILHNEVPPLLERRRAEGVRIFPLIAEPCAWQTVGWLRQMNLRPTDARPLSSGNENQINADLAALASEIYLFTKSVAAALAPHQKFVPLNPYAISISRLPVTGRELFGRDLELDMLDGAWVDPNTNVLTLVAWGGVGKSALVNYWLRGMRRGNFRGAEKVYAWSFYRQGTSEQGVSADQFIDAALRWFGDPDPTAGTPWDKGERLASFIKRQRTLLLLDGLEPLQFPPGRGHQEGALKEHTMQALLRELAAHNPGLCLITSRLAVADLADSEGDTARRVNLEHLSPQAGAELLRGQGVKGEQAELELASTEFGGHALALTLLGSYLTTVHDGDIARRDRVDILREDEEQGGHARRVIASYENWFGEGPELSVLRILGLFDRPADAPCIAALRADPVIPGLTDALQGLTGDDWRRTLNRLRTAKLIADRDSSGPDALDAHPLVREYFKRQLKDARLGAWREGNNRLYEHLKTTTKEFPETIEEIMPLYTAVAYGSKAGRYEEALNEVYWKRISRGKEFFSTTKLGGISADLTALTNFFVTPWLQPVADLTQQAQALVLGLTAYRLRALGRCREAAQAYHASFEAWVSSERHDNAAIVATNLSELYLILGELPQALTYAQQSYELAERIGYKFQQLHSLGRKADALHYQGALEDSEATFRQAEQMQQEVEPSQQFLYSRSGFQFCDLLIEVGKDAEVEARATAALQISKRNSWLLDTALDHLSLGRALLLRVERGGEGDLTRAAEHLDQAVEGLRISGEIYELPRGLGARARLRRVKGEFESAQADLSHALDIAARGSMRLYQADCHLEYARLYLAEGDRVKAREHWERAREMVGRMGYHLRDEEVREIGEELGERVDG